MSKYPEYILRKLRQREGLDEADVSMDDVLNSYTPNRVFKEVCNWEGLIGWDVEIKQWIKDIYGVEA